MEMTCSGRSGKRVDTLPILSLSVGAGLDWLVQLRNILLSFIFDSSFFPYAPTSFFILSVESI
jgi:hypothetical protein